jgi:xylulokinase
MNQFFAGIDVSTQSQKLVVIDLDIDSIIYSDSINYDNDLPDYKTFNGVIRNNPPGVSESDPNMWIDGLHILFKRLSKRTDIIFSIKCLSVSGQQHGLVALDRKGNLAKSTSKLWNDFSTQKECDILTENIGGKDRMIAEISNSQRTGYTASKIFHMQRNEIELFNNTYQFMLVHNYVNYFLTGGVFAMEEGDASGTGLWDPVKKRWSENLTSIISKDLLSKLPPVSSSTESIGSISKELVKEYGFSSTCRIDAGSGDNMYGAIGTGNIDPGILTISLGTSGTAYTIVESPFVDPTGEIACFCDSTGRYLPLLCVSNMAGGYNSFLEKNGLSHSEFEALMTYTHPGNDGNVIVPWYEGERTPDLPNASPIYFGFSYDDLTKEKVARGLIEGHVLNLYEGFSKMPIKPKEIYLTGGLSQSKVWCQMIADIFNCKATPVLGEGAALGAALHAGWIWNNENGSNETLSKIVKPFITFNEQLGCTPKDENIKVYDNLKSLYSSITMRIRGLDAKDPFELKQGLKG